MDDKNYARIEYDLKNLENVTVGQVAESPDLSEELAEDIQRIIQEDTSEAILDSERGGKAEAAPESKVAESVLESEEEKSAETILESEGTEDVESVPESEGGESVESVPESGEETVAFARETKQASKVESTESVGNIEKIEENIASV